MPTRATSVPSPAALPVIEITWVDAQLDPSTDATLSQSTEVRAFGLAPLMQDVGYLVRHTSDIVVLAVSRCNSDNLVRHSNTIPRSLIRGVEVLSGVLPCPMKALLPARSKVKVPTTSPIGSPSTSAATSPSTTVCSTTKPQRPLSASS